jgi:hypothetical protein
MNLQYLMRKPPFDEKAKRLAIITRLNKIQGVFVEPNRVDKRPSFSLAVLTDAAALRQFLSLLDWAVAEIRRSTLRLGADDRRLSPRGAIRNNLQQTASVMRVRLTAVVEGRI